MNTFRFLRLATSIGILAGFSTLAANAFEPIRAHPQNPYILEFRDQPTVLRTFAEQYSSVINSNFDFVPYLNVLQRDGMNLTRAFLLGFRLVQSDNSSSPLVVAPANFVQPWPRANTSGNALDGLGKWNFAVWNEDYFVRLNAFAQACSDRGVVIELTLFCSQYDNSHWAASPFHPANNVQGYGPASHFDSMRLVDANLVAVQEAAVRRIVREVNRFDNIYYEIQNEPFWNDPGVKDAQEVAFHNRMLEVIRDEESRLPNQHLVAHNFPQYANTLSGDFDVINEHYPAVVPGSTIAGAEALLRDHYARGKILALDETATSNVPQTRLEAWMFILGGGGIYNGLDVVNPIYTEQSEAGDNTYGNAIRGAVRNLGIYLNDLHLVDLRRNLSWITGLPAGATLQAMSHPGQQYVAYLHHGRGGITNFQIAYAPIDGSNHVASPAVTLGQGAWRAVWTRPSDLMVLRTEEFTHAGGAYTLAPVTYQEDVALRIDRIGEEPVGEDIGAFINGSFESSYHGWTASGNHQVQSATPDTLPHGINYLAFNNGNTTPNGVLEQTFATTPGQTYDVTLHLGTLSYNTNEQRLQADVIGNASLGSHSFSILGLGGGSTHWVANGFSFTADSTATTLTLSDRSLTTHSLDMLLDNVRVALPAGTLPPEEIPLATPSITQVGDAFRIAMAAVEPGSYGLERSTDLVTWAFVAEIQILEPGPLDFTDPQTAEKRMFYRIARY